MAACNALEKHNALKAAIQTLALLIAVSRHGLTGLLVRPHATTVQKRDLVRLSKGWKRRTEAVVLLYSNKLDATKGTALYTAWLAIGQVGIFARQHVVGVHRIATD